MPDAMDRYMNDPDYGPADKLLMEWTEAGGLGTAAAVNARAVLAELAALRDAAQTVCAALDDAGRLHATTGGPALAALIRR